MALATNFLMEVLLFLDMIRQCSTTASPEDMYYFLMGNGGLGNCLDNPVESRRYCS